jgi:hypothetical protein
MTDDHYAVLQVHSGAEPEVIEAAYRQLMKKYHPDVAGDDPDAVALHHRRAIEINRAYSVLRDPKQRRLYDTMRGGAGPASARRPARQQHSTSRGAWARNPAAANQAQSTVAPPPRPDPPRSALAVALRKPLVALSTAYYLLPGPYEWESGRAQELRTVLMVPPLAVTGFALATGRLAPWIGHSLNAQLAMWAVLLLLSLPMWHSLPRVAMAGLPSLVLLSGDTSAFLRQVHMPIALAWVFLGVLSLILSARLYVFAVLPSLGLCWLLTRSG